MNEGNQWKMCVHEMTRPPGSHHHTKRYTSESKAQQPPAVKVYRCVCNFSRFKLAFEFEVRAASAHFNWNESIFNRILSLPVVNESNNGHKQKNTTYKQRVHTTTTIKITTTTQTGDSNLFKVWASILFSFLEWITHTHKYICDSCPNSARTHWKFTLYFGINCRPLPMLLHIYNEHRNVSSENPMV